MISNAVEKLFELIMLLMLIQVLLTWFPRINWHNEPFCSLKKFTDLIFGPFRKIIPPIGMIDISPIIAFIVMGLIERLCVGLLIGIGL